MYFEYGSKEIKFLKGRDELLGAAIDRIGHIYRAVDGDLFSSVVHHIIGQQISTRAQATIWQRLSGRIGNINAAAIDSLELDELQKLGMTFKKAGYIKDFAEKVGNKEFDIAALTSLPDAEVIKELSALKGIGVWTAEMIMTFCMQRPDIVSFGDLAIHRGMRMLYHHRSIDKKNFAQYARRYSPYGTVASLYLWAIASGEIPEMRDYAPQKRKEAAKK
ncbi:MAG TPA: DNA-3-methyladenine glycosylase [Methylomusa anaerophila]|uniref:DNA-3-methyladenine glycosylase II n=1 Tax=Methylomusa anaerophila TaxID=1930071 RepID=A0A348AIE1_9FIRM|nr:DNA-3-methyladenine glycosylase [Methylomusa anaerophila]BBB90839.1 DNA-3-methyladenine glycosylase [Methylomusa anaerophila]HML90633.1 DNA-3-methyladenine glycosylase [Methylomusa anaerophila]